MKLNLEKKQKRDSDGFITSKIEGGVIANYEVFNCILKMITLTF